MPVCYFNLNYAEIHRCDYVITDDGIEISVEYDIMNEVPSVNGMRVFGGNTKFDARDILIVDHHSKRNILVKQAYYAGHTRTYGTLDDGSNTKFLGHLYFEHNVLDQLTRLPVMPKIKTIKIYSTAILDWTGIPSLEVTDSSDYLNYRLSKNVTPSTIPINIQNIKQISVSDDWTLNGDGGSHISIDFLGCIEIELLKRINYDKIYDFIYELIIFLQLYCPDRFSVQKIHVMIDNVFYRCSVPLPETRIKGKHVQNTVRADLLSFLKSVI